MRKVYVLYTTMYTYVCICAAVGVLWLSAAGLEGLIVRSFTIFRYTPAVMLELRSDRALDSNLLLH